MRHPSLTLYAASPGAAIAHTALLSSLKSHELIGRSVGEHHFLAGDAFFRQIVFLGCSPSIPLSPEQGDHYIRIQLQSTEVPCLLIGERAKPPLCLSCKAPLHGWKAGIADSADTTILCHVCRSRLNIGQLNFRKKACYSRSIIQIQPVYESEAVPDTQLLQRLGRQFDCVFKYAYT